MCLFSFFCFYGIPLTRFSNFCFCFLGTPLTRFLIFVFVFFRTRFLIFVFVFYGTLSTFLFFLFFVFFVFFFTPVFSISTSLLLILTVRVPCRFSHGFVFHFVSVHFVFPFLARCLCVPFLNERGRSLSPGFIFNARIGA